MNWLNRIFGSKPEPPAAEPEPQTPVQSTTALAVIPDPVVIQPLVALIRIEPEDQPAFSRHYKVPVSSQVMLEIDAKTSYGERRYQGWLHQWDGRLVGFDPRAIADRILDRELVPVLEKLCPPIIAEDQRFLRLEANEFSDKSGARWIRA